MSPHLHISAVNVLVYALSALLILGVLNLLSMKYPDNRLSASWMNLYSPSR